LGGDAAEREVVVCRTRKRQCEDRHIIDRSRLYERLACALRDKISVGEKLLIEEDDRFFFILTDLNRTIAIAAPGDDVE
jgi:hypothetical protein